MSRRVLAVIAFAWVLSLVGVAVLAQSAGPKTYLTGEPMGPVITGENIGFQPIASPPTKEGALVGKWMVKLNGKWVDTAPFIGIVRGGGGSD